MIPRFYITPPLAQLGSEFKLPDDIFHHAVNVLRLKINDELVLFDGMGHAAQARLSQIEKKSASAILYQHCNNHVESPLSITLAQCLSSSDKMDWTIEKAVELGVNRIVPLFSAKSQIKLSPERAIKKMDHWQRIIHSACAQCGRNTLPILETPSHISTFLNRTDDAYKLMLHPDSSVPFKTLTKPTHTTEIILLVGPEAGFNDTEQTLAQDAGFITTLLGPRILRTESAGLAAIAALQATWGDF